MSEVKSRRFYKACSNGNKELALSILKTLDSKQKLNFVHWHGTPLHEACRHGWLDIVQLLVEKYNHSVNESISWSHDYKSPLHIACQYGRVDIVIYLIEHGCNPCLRDQTWNEPIDYALKFDHINIAHHICKHYITSTMTLATDREKTTLDLVHKILKRMVRGDSPHLDWITSDGDSILEVVFHSKKIMKFLSPKKMLKLITGLKTDDKLAVTGSLPYFICREQACVLCIPSVVMTEWLGDTHLDPEKLIIVSCNWKTADGDTLLQLACHTKSCVSRISSKVMLKWLNNTKLDHKFIRPNFKTVDGKSLLQVLCKSESYVSLVPSKVMLNWLTSTRQSYNIEFVVPKYTTADGDTLLQLVCQTKSCVSRISSRIMLEWLNDTSQKLDYKLIRPNSRTADGKILFQVLCQSKSCVSHISSRVMLKWLTDNVCSLAKGMVPNYNIMTADGDTLLQLVCQSKMCVSHLPSSKLIQFFRKTKYDLLIPNQQWKTASDESLMSVVSSACGSQFFGHFPTSNVVLIMTPHWKNRNGIKILKVLCFSEVHISELSSASLLTWLQKTNIDISNLKVIDPQWKTADGDTLLEVICQSESYISRMSSVVSLNANFLDLIIHSKPLLSQINLQAISNWLNSSNLTLVGNIISSWKIKDGVSIFQVLCTSHGCFSHISSSLMLQWLNEMDETNYHILKSVHADWTTADGDTFIHLLCKSSLNEEKVTRLKQHYLEESVRDLNPEIMKALISLEAKVTSDVVFKTIKSLEEHEASEILLLSSTRNTMLWKPTDLNHEGDTALHLACRVDKPAVVKYLLKYGKCSSMKKNSSDELPLELTTNIDTISLLIEHGAELVPKLVMKFAAITKIPKLRLAQLMWNPDITNSEGNTALHLACQSDQPELVNFLLSQAHCDPNVKNNNNEVPLQMTANSEIIKDLIRYGAQTSMMYESHKSALGTKEPIKPPVKIFIVGNPSVGKSTLTEALKKKLNFLALLISRKVSGVEKKTAGIIPHEIESKIFGPVKIYDFAGHREFYSGHAALLKAAIQLNPPIFLLLVNLLDEEEKIIKDIFYWISFLENQCILVSCKPHLIIVGSHADTLESKGVNPQDKVDDLNRNLLNANYFINLELIGFIPMDCQLHESAGMNNLRPLLVKSCNQLRIQEPITFNAHCFLVYLLDTVNAYCTISNIHKQIKNQLSSHREGVLDFLPTSVAALYKICTELNERGHILFLRDKKKLENSYVIIEEKSLLSEVSGTVFASEDFKQYKQLSTNTGVVSLSKIAECFPDKDVNILIGFLTHLEFCHEISDQILFQQISEKYSQVADERYYLFPGLISIEVEKSIWGVGSDFDYTFEWILQCTKPEQFFSSRFLHVLLLRLAFSSAFELNSPSEDDDGLAIHRKCSLWKNGIFWGIHYSMDTLVEITDNKSIVVMARFKASQVVQCLKHRSQVLQTILECVEEFCPRNSTAESFIGTSSNLALEYPYQFKPERILCSIKDLAEALIMNSENPSVVLSQSGKSVSAQSFFSFEPYAELEASIINELWDKENSKEVVPNEFLLRLVEKVSSNLPFLIKVFNKDSHIPCSKSDLYEQILNWRNSSKSEPKTYSQLRELYDQHSVFAGRNPLDIAGIEVSSLATHSIKTVSVSPKVGHINEQRLRDITPNLDELLVLKFANGKELRIMEKVAPFWKRVAISLGFDETRIKNIEMGCHYQSEDACREMFSLWLEGVHSCLKPTTWSSLIQALNFVNQMEIAVTILENLILHEEDESNIQCSLPEPSMPRLSVSQNTTSSMKGLQNFQSSLKVPPAESLPEDSSTLLPFLVQGDEAPELKDLLLLEFSNGKELKIVDRVTHIWKDIAITLGFNRAKIKGIEMSCHFQPEDGTLEMFRQWLKGAHSELKPATWSTLIQSLKDVKLIEASNMLTTMQIKDDKTSDQSSSDSSLMQLHTPCGQQSAEFQCSLRHEILDEHPSNRMVNECDHQQSEVQSTKGIFTKCSLPTLNMKTLELLEGHGGRKIKVIEGVSSHWKDLAVELEIQKEIIDQIEEKFPSHSHQEACGAVLARWLEGDGGEVSWSNLTQGLITAGLPELADDLRDTLKM